MSDCARVHTLKPGKCPFRFIGRAERSDVKPECISPPIERQRAQHAVGPTLAAQELCTKVRPYLRQHHVQTGVGHYGVFNGRRWEGRIYPILREFIHSSE